MATTETYAPDQTASTIEEQVERDAKARAAALDRAFGQDASADAHRLCGSWYVVTRGTGEGYDFAYEATDVDPAVVSAPDWNYSEWCSSVGVDNDLDVAVAYYMAEGRQLGDSGGSPVLTAAQLEALTIARNL